MVNISKFSPFLLAGLVSISLGTTVDAQSTETLTVVVNGLRHQNGQLCLRVYGNDKGFPTSNAGEVQSACTKITGTSVKKQFYGLKPGTYAVAVVDDENGDRKLNKDFFGIPQEGFGISNNPTVSIITGTPKFSQASFSLKQNQTINISMKYQLDS